MGYSAFARYYDRFTENIDYSGRAAYFHQLFAHYGALPKTILDLACGTGSLSYPLADLGYTVIGADSSEEMLIEAAAKMDPMKESTVQFIAQSMEEIDLPQPVDAVICALDSINHLEDEEALAAVFRRLYLCCKPSGYFIFDVNSYYKQSVVLGDNCFVFQDESVYLGWQNSFYPEDGVVDIELDFFVAQPDGNYRREQEYFSQIYFSKAVLKHHLETAGFSLVDVFGEDSMLPPKDEDQRLIYIAQRNRE